MLVKFFSKSILFSIIFIKLREIRNNLIFLNIANATLLIQV